MATAPAAGVALYYKISHHTTPSPHLEIVVSFQGSESGMSAFILPSNWKDDSGVSDISNIAMRTAGTQLNPTSYDWVYAIQHPPSQALEISYDVYPRLNQQKLRPVPDHVLVAENFFQFIGNSVLAIPDTLPTHVPQRVRFDWVGSTPKFNVATSHGIYTSQEAIITPKQLLEGLYVGGDIFLWQDKVLNKPILIAANNNVVGQQPELIKKINQIITWERQFWQDNDFPYFLISLIDTSRAGEESDSFHDGRSVFHAYTIFYTRSSNDATDLIYVNSHEHIHTWIGHKLQSPMPQHKVDWFFEGFTEYYGLISLLRAGMIDLTTYVDRYNAVLSEYYLSPAREQSNDYIITYFGRSYDTMRLPYMRGQILAHELNYAVRHANSKKSLDQVVKDLLYYTSKNPDLLVDMEIFANVAARYTSPSIIPYITQHVEQGKTIMVSPEALGPCVTLHAKDTLPPLFGFNLTDSLDKLVVTGVDTQGNAFRQGLRDGQIIRKYVIDGDQSDLPLIIDVQEGNKQSTLTLRRTSGAVKVPQYHVDKGRLAKDPQGCMRILGLS
jgi:predicted metalloprotease with PDZ domain